MRTVIAVAAVVVAAVTGAAIHAQRGQGAPPLIRENATERISEHVYVIPDNNVGMVPNVGIIVGSRGTFVVDTGMGARNGQTIVREMQKVSKTPELYLASTHIHPEHDLGAGGFPSHTKMVRSQAQVDEIASAGLAQAERFAGFSPINAELLKGAEFRKADITFDRELNVDLGGVRVRVLEMGYNHTRGDQAFFVEPDGILFSGDVAMSALPNIGQARSATWLASMDRFEKLQPKRIVPSHGRIGDGVEFVTTYRNFIRDVQSRVAAQKKQGKSVDETVTAVTAELQEKYPTAGQRLAGAARAIYEER
jgi:glyoxylase-like metal-dependent hydrolase (beta-lactamase superfamily II)